MGQFLGFRFIWVWVGNCCIYLGLLRRSVRNQSSASSRLRAAAAPTTAFLLFEILLRFPADHLYDRAMLVCRRWYHIIHSRTFINVHVQMHGATYGLLLSAPYEKARPIYITATADGGIHTSVLAYRSDMRVLATSNGLALEMAPAKDWRFDCLLHLVNPATKQLFHLPPFPRGVSYGLLGHGFAYSAASSAYKVIAQYTVCPSAPRPQTDYGLDVLTVGVDESWRHVEVHHLPDHLRLFFFNNAPLTTEGFLHWGWGKCCATMDVETEIITLSEVPYEYLECYCDNFYLSTGRCLSLLVACGDLSWEVWEMKSETGEWRKALPNVDLGAQKCRIQQFSDRVLEPLGWVKYPKVLAFYFGPFTSGRHCIFYNLDTHQLDSIELPQSYCRDYDAFPHKNNLIWLS